MPTALPVLGGIATKPCGECRECCIHLPINFIDDFKPAHVPCDNLCESGCSIYDHRPNECEHFFCAWKVIPPAEIISDAEHDAMRPDRSGVIVFLQDLRDDPTDDVCRVVASETRPGSMNEAANQQFALSVAMGAQTVIHVVPFDHQSRGLPVYQMTPQVEYAKRLTNVPDDGALRNVGDATF